MTYNIAGAYSATPSTSEVWTLTVTLADGLSSLPYFITFTPNNTPLSNPILSVNVVTSDLLHEGTYQVLVKAKLDSGEEDAFFVISVKVGKLIPPSVSVQTYTVYASSLFINVPSYSVSESVTSSWSYEVK